MISSDVAVKIKPRKIHLDFLRIIAIFLVLYNHTQTRGFVLFTVSRKSPFYWLYLAFSVFDKIGAWLFFMISGALLLNREETEGTVLKKRIPRFFIALVLCSAVGYLYRIRYDFSRFSIYDFMKGLYTGKAISAGKVTNASWFLYSYLSFLLILPILQKLAKSLSNRQFVYLFCLYAGFQMLNIADFLCVGGGISR